ncbi:unnamed protein product [Didymodactylos carnosus]|uniref:Mediator of RNA polymerase II transcription subunit 14 n=1 Tax=Didymodactylos carnosus TaxID=1234261 RepID=A0A816DGT4_9BILA|nr:unnamed protein product [Didymodactylos carnosus]CAF4538302.1 unnamed protein product [Didymodactylos carnosus]
MDLMQARHGGVPFQSHDKTPLSHLLEIAVHKTYHDLITTTDLMARKPEVERKIDIVMFASRTRQLFIRILAVVKWARLLTIF